MILVLLACDPCTGGSIVGAAVEGAEVTLSPCDGGRRRSTTAGTGGHFEFTGLEIGCHGLTAEWYVDTDGTLPATGDCHYELPYSTVDVDCGETELEWSGETTAWCYD